MSEFGIILVRDGRIYVRYQHQDGCSKSDYVTANIEDLQDAARILASLMDLKFEHPDSECRRVSDKDQLEAILRELVEQSQEEAAKKQ